MAGGYPAALARRAPARRLAWYRDYVDTQVQRDVRDVTRVRSLDALPKLLALAASHTARLINVSDLSSPFELTRQTIHEYVSLLERVFLLERLPSWHTNRLNRLVKRPKLHIGDTGIACALLGLDAAGLDHDRPLLGAMLETFVPCPQGVGRAASSSNPGEPILPRASSLWVQSSLDYKQRLQLLFFPRRNRGRRKSV